MVVKRDGSIQEFDFQKISNAIAKCFKAVGNNLVPSSLEAAILSEVSVYDTIGVEDIQDIVEKNLMLFGFLEEAKAYILYRAERAKKRGRVVPLYIKERFEETSKNFPTALQQFQFFDKYSRFNWDTGTREVWEETVTRAVNYLRKLSENKLSESDYNRIFNSMLEMEVMPSMRLVASAGVTADRNNIAIYNCSFMPIDDVQAFSEALIISMNGCGVGYSVEKVHVAKLPVIAKRTNNSRGIFVVPDTTEGWAEAVALGIDTWINGDDIEFDFSLIRPFGSILKTKGGTASGPEPLRYLLEKIREVIFSREGSDLRTIDAHDIMCYIGGAAIAGGSRRSSMIAIFDFDDEDMRDCKSGNMDDNQQRYNANNSAVWEKEKSFQEVFDFMSIVFKSGRGEPGIFSRHSAMKTMPERRKRVSYMGTNPCGEIILRPHQFCNLSVAVARPWDTRETLLRKVEIATIVGTIQSLATNFPGLRPIWKENCEEERLLGVDITGHMDCEAVRNADTLSLLKERAKQVNEIYAKVLGINPSAAITCVKPSGNSSQLLDTSSGMHPRYSEYYIRNVRIGAGSAMAKVLLDAGVPIEPSHSDPAQTWVASFPVASPEKAITTNDVTALEMLNYWLTVKQNWTEHNPSITITYKPEDVLDIIQWVYKNQELIGGMTFYPYSGAKYSQVPYMSIDKETYKRRASLFPEIDFSLLYKYENYDTTSAFQELACSSGVCEI